MTGDARRHAPATARNREPILAVLRRVLPPRGLVLEVASGTGQHVAHFAATLGPGLLFQPSDPSAEARASIDAWIAASGVVNVAPALELDASAPVWPVTSADAILCINMVHISPWSATVGLLAGAGRILPAGGPLVLYGPYRRNGAHTADSNAAFDRSLRAENPAWGVRDLEAVVALAREEGFAAPEIVEMPANNLGVILRRGART